MLAELGQKGGILKLVAKVALLWGGIRGAMSLTNKLISFLRMAERPLSQRYSSVAPVDSVFRCGSVCCSIDSSGEVHQVSLFFVFWISANT